MAEPLISNGCEPDEDEAEPSSMAKGSWLALPVDILQLKITGLEDLKLRKTDLNDFASMNPASHRKAESYI